VQPADAVSISGIPEGFELVVPSPAQQEVELLGEDPGIALADRDRGAKAVLVDDCVPTG